MRIIPRVIYTTVQYYSNWEENAKGGDIGPRLVPSRYLFLKIDRLSNCITRIRGPRPRWPCHRGSEQYSPHQSMHIARVSGLSRFTVRKHSIYDSRFCIPSIPPPTRGPVTVDSTVGNFKGLVTFAMVSDFPAHTFRICCDILRHILTYLGPKNNKKCSFQTF